MDHNPDLLEAARRVVSAVEAEGCVRDDAPAMLALRLALAEADLYAERRANAALRADVAKLTRLQRDALVGWGEEVGARISVERERDLLRGVGRKLATKAVDFSDLYALARHANDAMRQREQAAREELAAVHRELEHTRAALLVACDRANDVPSSAGGI
jgi:hypothetical protein